MKGRRFAAFANLLLAALLMLTVWVLVVWVASRPGLKTLWDLTPQQSNSVDPVTEELLGELREQRTEVEFHLFFPPLPPAQGGDDAQRQWLAIRQRLRELATLLLRRYQWLGGELLQIRQHDLYMDPAAAREAAQAFGVTEADDMVVVAVRPSGRERRFRKLSLAADLAEISLPELQPQAGPVPRVAVPVLKRWKGEVALSSALKSLLVQGVPVAYFLTSYSVPDLDLGNTAIGTAYGGLVQGLQRLGFEIRQLDLSRERAVPRDAALVVVIEPRREFTDLDAQALFDHVQRGGRLFLNYAWSPVAGRNPTGGKLGELLGFELGEPLLAHLIPDVNGRTAGRGLDGDDAVFKLQLLVNQVHPVSKRIAQGGRAMEVASARELRERPGAPQGLQREDLLRTGPYGWSARAGADGRPDNRSPQVGLRDFLVGMAIEVAPKEGADQALPRGQVVVVSGLFCNNAGLPFFGDLAYNICNWMAERRVLLDIQGNQYASRTLQDLPPQQRARIKDLLVLWVPGAFLVLGLVVVTLRRRI